LEVASKQAQGELPPYKAFQPACIAHTKRLVASLDRAYTDVQLREVLENECSLDKMFVSVETGFGDYDACKRFANSLVEARNKELEKGSTEGYKTFCDGYYEFKGGKVEKPQKEKSKEEESKKETSEKDEFEEKKPKQENSEATKVGDVDESKKVDAEVTGKAASLKGSGDGGEAELEERPNNEAGTTSKPSVWKEIPTWALAAIFLGTILVLIAAAR